jgi:hypothetical protein
VIVTTRLLQLDRQVTTAAHNDVLSLLRVIMHRGILAGDSDHQLLTIWLPPPSIGRMAIPEREQGQPVPTEISERFICFLLSLNTCVYWRIHTRKNKEILLV